MKQSASNRPRNRPVVGKLVRDWFGSNASYSRPASHFRSARINGHRQIDPAGPFRANKRLVHSSNWQSIKWRIACADLAWPLKNARRRTGTYKALCPWSWQGTCFTIGTAGDPNWVLPDFYRNHSGPPIVYRRAGPALGRRCPETTASARPRAGRSLVSCGQSHASGPASQAFMEAQPR